MADKKTTANLVDIASGRVKNCIVKKINIELLNKHFEANSQTISC